MSAKIYKSDAARQQAYRDRKAAERKAARIAAFAAARNHAHHQQRDPVCLLCNPEVGSPKHTIRQNQIPVTVIEPQATSVTPILVTVPTPDAETVSKMFVAEQQEEEHEGRAKPRYHIVLEIEGSRLETISKKAKEAFGDSLKTVEKVTRIESRSDSLGMAEALFQDAQGIVEELKGEMEEWRDSIPESLQYGDKASEVEDCIGQLEELENNLNDIGFENVEFPSMF